MDIPHFLRSKSSSAIAIALLVTIAAGCSSSPPAPKSVPNSPPIANSEKVQEIDVDILGFKFSPDVHTVPAGTIVSWVNKDPYFHTVTSGKTDGPMNEPDGKFDKDLKEEGDVINITFDTPGTYTYFCKQHNAMNAEIRVS